MHAFGAVHGALISSLVAVPTLRLCASNGFSLEFWLFWARPQPIVGVKLNQKVAHTSSFGLSFWAVMQHLYPATLQPNRACSDATVLLCFQGKSMLQEHPTSMHPHTRIVSYRTVPCIPSTQRSSSPGPSPSPYRFLI